MITAQQVEDHCTKPAFHDFCAWRFPLSWPRMLAERKGDKIATAQFIVGIHCGAWPLSQLDTSPNAQGNFQYFFNEYLRQRRA